MAAFRVAAMVSGWDEITASLGERVPSSDSFIGYSVVIRVLAVPITRLDHSITGTRRRPTSTSAPSRTP
jgi:hypothetical protein